MHTNAHTSLALCQQPFRLPRANKVFSFPSQNTNPEQAFKKMLHQCVHVMCFPLLYTGHSNLCATEQLFKNAYGDFNNQYIIHTVLLLLYWHLKAVHIQHHSKMPLYSALKFCTRIHDIIVNLDHLQFDSVRSSILGHDSYYTCVIL